MRDSISIQTGTCAPIVSATMDQRQAKVKQINNIINFLINNLILDEQRCKKDGSSPTVLTVYRWNLFN